MGRQMKPYKFYGFSSQAIQELSENLELEMLCDSINMSCNMMMQW